MSIHPRLLNQLFENPSFQVDKYSLGYVVRDLINMNWWNTCGWHTGYAQNKRVQADCPERIKLIAVQLKEFYRARILDIRDERAFRHEVRDYIRGKRTTLPQQSAFSMRARANPSQYFVDAKTGEMTWVDCTSRATYAAKYVAQNGYIDFDGKCRVIDGSRVAEFIQAGKCYDIGVTDAFVDGASEVKAEIFSQKNIQYSVAEWITKLGIVVIPERQWLFDAVSHVRTDPYKIFEAYMVRTGQAPGLNECMYGYRTSASKEFVPTTFASSASRASQASRASHASDASSKSDASYASHASDASAASNASMASSASNASMASSASRASDASHESNASRARRASAASHESNASRARRASAASDAGATWYSGKSWEGCPTAIKCPAGLRYPVEFRSKIFAIAGNWKINKDLVQACKLGWFDPFMGHGTSPMLAKQLGKRYHGIDTNALAFETHLNLIREILTNEPGSQIVMEQGDSTVFRPDLVGQFDLCYTSPPYFNFEEYGGNTSHFAGCETYSDFHSKISIPVLRNVFEYLVPGSTLAYQVEKDERHRAEWTRVIESVGFEHVHATTQGHVSSYSKQAKRDQNLLLFTKP